MHHIDRQILAEELHYYHQLSGYTVRQLAERTRLPLETITSIEAGVIPDNPQAKLLMSFLGIAEDDLRTRTKRTYKTSF